MDISQSINNIKSEFEFLRQEFSIISVNSNSEGTRTHFLDVGDFLRATKGFDVKKSEHTKELEELEEYFAIIDEVRCFILVDEEEEKQLLEGLEDERVATKS